MDNLTHALTGAALSKAGLERATPLATATLVLAANAPDVDVLAYAGGPYFALAFRRGVTHGLPAMVVLPFLVTAAVLAWDRWVRRRRDPDAPPVRPAPVLALSVLGLLTHPALDWMNTYGMRWWMPFDAGWSYGDALFIVDPWLWLLLGGATVLGGRWSRPGLVAWGLLGAAASAPVLLGPVPDGAKWAWVAGVGAAAAGVRLVHGRHRRHGARLARVLTAAALLYVGAMMGSDALATRRVERAAAAAGMEVLEVMVAPSPAAPLSAEVEVITPEGYVPGRWSWTGDTRVVLRPEDLVPHLATSAEGAREEELVARVVARARAVPAARSWLVWSRYPYVRVVADGDGWTVRFSDARYDDGAGAGSLGGVTVRVESADLAR